MRRLLDRRPILVKDYAGDQAMTIRCTSCDAERVINGDELCSDDIYDCPDGCGYLAEHKYVIVDECKNCKRLGFWTGGAGADGTGDGYCSRVCKLQDEFAQGVAA